ncbi:MAG: class I SAM-dependent methyltransferase [Acidobacteriota bacterium]
MREYDDIGLKYLESRSPTIGVADVLGLVETFGRKISVLDLGCGTGWPIAEALWPETSRYVGVDSSRVLLGEFRRRLPEAEAILGSVHEVALDAAAFDLVFAYGSLFHLTPSAQRVAVLKACRAVAPGGTLAFTSGVEAGACTGTVAGISVPHWSIGEKAYVELAASCGLVFEGSLLGEGQNLFFLFSRAAG